MGKSGNFVKFTSALEYNIKSPFDSSLNPLKAIIGLVLLMWKCTFSYELNP